MSTNRTSLCVYSTTLLFICEDISIHRHNRLILDCARTMDIITGIIIGIKDKVHTGCLKMFVIVIAPSIRVKGRKVG